MGSFLLWLFLAWGFSEINVNCEERMRMFRKCQDVGSLLLILALLIIACVIQALGEENRE
ncbi:hypothetical protein FC699_21450 [Bacillus wiedmannii]|uniref:Uncharacterized protein n=1 Tax=Bacillus wiedmannii TaxID=1890302 RepID=A0A4U2MJ85_9BACI|nr:hypothetical protein FC694_24765 [Bacillus wiedmannii]TKI91760.1 hypothetical protein FC699_21450 [Bacillus wiedmannii]